MGLELASARTHRTATEEIRVLLGWAELDVGELAGLDPGWLGDAYGQCVRAILTNLLGQDWPERLDPESDLRALLEALGVV